MRKSPGEFQPLQFTTGEVTSVFLYPGPVAFFITDDTVMNLRVPCGYDDFISLYCVVSHSYIVEDGVLKHHGFLIHCEDRGMKDHIRNLFPMLSGI